MIRRMDAGLVILLSLVAFAALVAYVRNPSLPVEGLYASGRLFGRVWLELLLGFLVAGLLDVLVSPGQVTAWLGIESSMRGDRRRVADRLGHSRRTVPAVSDRGGTLEGRCGPGRLDCADYRQDAGEPDQDVDL